MAIDGLEPMCWLGRHADCALEQFYGRDLDCECECHAQKP